MGSAWIAAGDTVAGGWLGDSLGAGVMAGVVAEVSEGITKGLALGDAVGTAVGATVGASVGATVGASVGWGVSLSIETVGGLLPSGMMTTLSPVQTAARLASGAIAAETDWSLDTVPTVLPPSATVQLPSEAVHSVAPPLIWYTPESDAIQ
jgi:hypothetical protein